MKNPKAKGSAFEREICKKLSLWVTHGERTDVFWRSAMSGGRATVARKKGSDVQQCGDICAVRPEGFPLTNYWYLECKAYKDLQIASFILTDKGHLARFWNETLEQAINYNRHALLIAKQNGLPTMVLATTLPIAAFRQVAGIRGVGIVLLDDLLRMEFRV